MYSGISSQFLVNKLTGVPGTRRSGSHGRAQWRRRAYWRRLLATARRSTHTRAYFKFIAYYHFYTELNKAEIHLTSLTSARRSYRCAFAGGVTFI